LSEHIDIPGYKILSKLGEGATSTVWLARQESLNREVAIKILRPQYAADTTEVQAFLREAHAVAKLKSRHIIQVIDIGEYADTIYLVMEYADGCPVRQLLDAGRPLALKQAFGIAIPVASALSEAWEAEKIIHRDIKPDNIILDKRGEVKIADLGLAGFVDKRGHLIGEEPGLIAGTPNYMSPEQAAGSNAMNFATDMYSLGAVLYHMLTGRMPFNGLSTQDILRAQIEDQVQHPREINPRLSLGGAQVISRLMMKAPAQRYPDWKSAIADFQRVLDGSPVPVKTPNAGASTIAARSDTRLRLQKPASGTSTGTAVTPLEEDNTPVTPGWMKYPPSALLAFFLAWLFYALLWVPWRDSKVPGKTVAPGLPATSRPPMTAPARESDDQWLNPTPDPVPESREQQTPDIATDTPPVATPSESEGQQLLGILKNSIVHVATSSGFADAAALLEQQRNEPALADAKAQLADLARFLAPENRPHSLIAAQFRQHIGQDTFIHVGNRRVDFRVEAVNAGVVHTIVKAPPGSNTADYPAELRIDVLEPAEQRRWIGTADTPEKAFSAAILELKSGNGAAALALADDCGPFADAIRQFAGKRIPEAAE
jgi:serine/threonine protein kinase